MKWEREGPSALRWEGEGVVKCKPLTRLGLTPSPTSPACGRGKKNPRPRQWEREGPVPCAGRVRVVWRQQFILGRFPPLDLERRSASVAAASQLSPLEDLHDPLFDLEFGPQRPAPSPRKLAAGLAEC